MVGIAWTETGLVLILLGECLGWLGGSLYWREIVGPRGRRAAAGRSGRRAAHRRVRAARRSRAGPSRAPATTCRDGGLPWPLAEMCLASGMRRHDRDCLRTPPACRAGGSARTRAAIVLAVPTATTADAARRRRRGRRASPARSGRTGGDALTSGDELPISMAGAAGGARGLAAGLHGGRCRGLSRTMRTMPMSAAEIERADQGEPARRRGADRGSGGRRRPLPRPHIVSETFRGKSRLQQHQLVYQALGGADGRRAARAGPDAPSAPT